MKKDDGYVAALIAATLLLVVILVGSIKFVIAQSSSLAVAIDPRTQTAQVSGAVGNVYNLPCPSSKNLYSVMVNGFNDRIDNASVKAPSNATTDPARNTDFLKSWVSGLNFSGHSADHTGTDHYGYTLISPRHAVSAWHLNGYGVFVGQDVIFHSSKGDHTVKVAGMKQVSGTDIAVVVFDQDLPPDVAYYPILTSDDMFTYGVRDVPVIFYSQTGDFLIREAIATLYGGSNASVSLITYPSGSKYRPFGFELNDISQPNVLTASAYPGDSGRPGFYLIGNSLVLNSTQTTGDMAQLLGAHVSLINQTMTELDSGLSVPVTSGYRVTTLGMSCFTPFSMTSIPAQTFDLNSNNGSMIGKVAYTRSGDFASTTNFTIVGGNIDDEFSIDVDGRLRLANLSAFVAAHRSKYNLALKMFEVWLDGETRTVQGEVTINVSNSAPVLAPIGNKSVDANSNLSFTITATDPDGGTLTYSAEGLPSGATFNASTGAFSWTPVLAESGSSRTVTFKVDDSLGSIDSGTVTLSVSLGRYSIRTVPIVISAISAGTPGRTSATITWTTDKTSSSKVEYGLTNAYGSSTAISYTWVKSHSQTLSNLLSHTTYHFRVSSNDPVNNAPNISADQTFTTAADPIVETIVPDVTAPVVTPPPPDVTSPIVTLPNRSPVADAGLNISTTIPASASLSASASSDPDGDVLTYSWSKVSGPGTVTFSNISNVSTAVTFSEAGTYVLEVRVSDGSLNSTDRVNVTANLVPVTTYTLTASAGSHGSISPLGATTVNSGGSQVYVVTPATGYQVANVTVDGSLVSLLNSKYTFANVTASHSISVSFTQVVVPQPPYVPTPVVNQVPNPTSSQADDSSDIVTQNFVSSPAPKATNASTTDPIYELSLLTATSTDLNFTDPPTLSEFVASFVTEKFDKVVSTIRYVIDKVVSGLSYTMSSPSTE